MYFFDTVIFYQLGFNQLSITSSHEKVLDFINDKSLIFISDVITSSCGQVAVNYIIGKFYNPPSET